MVLKGGSFEQFVQDTAKKRIVIFGAGVLCHVWLPYLFARYDMNGRIAYCVDNRRHGEQVDINGRAIPVYPFEYLRTHAQDDQVLLISVSAFREIVEQIDRCPELDGLDCYIAPMMFIEHHHLSNVNAVPAAEPCIPKIIHYIWFSDKAELPPLVQRCIDSWRRFCPDYKIVRWDAANYDVTKNPDMYRAYRDKNWSFVSDFARLEILYEHGGIYFDTDVELIRNIDELLRQRAFISFEKWPVINSGGGMGAVQGFRLLGEMLEYKSACARKHAEEGTAPLASGFYETKPLLAHGLRMDGELQHIEGMTVYPYDYFHPYDYMSGRCEVSKNTYGIHHFNRSWVSQTAPKHESAYYQAMKQRMTGGPANGTGTVF